MFDISLGVALFLTPIMIGVLYFVFLYNNDDNNDVIIVKDFKKELRISKNIEVENEK